MKTTTANLILPILVSIILCSPTLFAKDYYVSPSGNNTTGNGTIGSPWKTLEFAINNVNPGDVLYLRAGIYNEQLISVRSGTANAYITIANYNNEDAIIDGTGAGRRNGVIIDHSYLKLIGFTVRNWADVGVWLRNCQFNELLKLKITGVSGGISLTGTVHDFVVDSCIMFDYYGGAGGSGFDATPYGTDSIYNGVIKNSKAYLTTGAFDNCDGFALGHEGVSNIYLYNCEVYGVGDGFDISGTNIKLERCSAHNCNYGGGYKLWRNDVTLINCIGYYNSTNVELDFDAPTQKGVKARLINCTFFGSSSSNIFIEMSTLGSKLEMFNCILAGSNNTGLTFGDSNSPDCYTGDYNLFHGYNSYRVISLSGPDFSSTQIQNGEWTTFSGQDAHSKVELDASILFKDTSWINPNLHLKAGSLAINNGTIVTGAPSADFDNSPRNDGRIDIGAYEYTLPNHVDDGYNNSTGGFMLEQNYPNPFNEMTNVGLRLKVRYGEMTNSNQQSMTLRVFDILGREVFSLPSDAIYNSSFIIHHFDLPSTGCYFYRVSNGVDSQTKMMVLLK